jgi:hypothetical protein
LLLVQVVLLQPQLEAAILAAQQLLVLSLLQVVAVVVVLMAEVVAEEHLMAHLDLATFQPHTHPKEIMVVWAAQIHQQYSMVAQVEEEEEQVVQAVLLGQDAVELVEQVFHVHY